MDVTKYTRIDSKSDSDNMESEDAILLTKDVSSLSSIGTSTHCLHLFDTHFKLFVAILLLVILPTMTPWNKIWVFLRTSPNPVSSDKVTSNHTTAAAPIAMGNSTAVATLSEILNSTAVSTPSEILNSTAVATPSDILQSTAVTNASEVWNSTAATSLTQSSGGAAPSNQDPNHDDLNLHWKDFDPTPGIVKAGLDWKRRVRADWTTAPVAAAKAAAKASLIFVFDKLLMITLISIRRCFVVYSAGRIQVRKRATFLDAARAFRVLWKRVIGTGICFEVIDFARIMFLYSPTLFFDKFEPGGSDLLYWLTFTTMLLCFIFFWCSGFAFQLATYVPILDEACGWEAFGRGWRLLKGKKRVSAGIAACSIMAYGIVLISMSLAIGAFVVGYGLSKGRLPDGFSPNSNSKPSREFMFWSSVLPRMAESVSVLFTEMIYAMFCMSCMAYHQQSIVRSSFFQKLTKTGRDHDC